MLPLGRVSFANNDQWNVCFALFSCGNISSFIYYLFSIFGKLVQDKSLFSVNRPQHTNICQIEQWKWQREYPPGRVVDGVDFLHPVQILFYCLRILNWYGIGSACVRIVDLKKLYILWLIRVVTEIVVVIACLVPFPRLNWVKIWFQLSTKFRYSSSLLFIVMLFVYFVRQIADDGVLNQG